MTNIYCTLGPSCSSLACLEAMVLQGLNGVRLNLSHASLEQEEDLIATVRSAFDHCGRPEQLLLDLQGPELRVGVFDEPVEIAQGTYIELDQLHLPEVVAEALQPGQELLLDDGKISIVVEGENVAFANRGGMLSSHKSVSVPGVDIELPCLTETDKANIAAAKKFGVTAVMQPFVRSHKDLETVRATLDAAGAHDVKLMAKIENLEGIEHLPELLTVADECIIARGDLGNAMPLWDLPAAQKHIAALCREADKPFMVATQLLSSMETMSVPTRAEVNDIFNAVLDGASAVMATGETAVGEHPIEVVRYLTNTVRSAEQFLAQSC